MLKYPHVYQQANDNPPAGPDSRFVNAKY